jgi:hypothetical protein
MRTEDDIRRAFRDLARQAPDTATVLANVLAGERPRRAGQPAPVRDRRRVWVRLAAPLGAVAAVTGLAVATVALAAARHEPGQPISSRLLASVPRYYVMLVQGRRGTEDAVIRNTVTGATISTIRPPKPFFAFRSVTAAADDRTFVLAASPLARGPLITEFFLARFSPGKRSVTLSLLPIPEINSYSGYLFGLALAPDGTQVAVDMQVIRKGAAGPSQIRIYSLPSGTVRVWQADGSTTLGVYSPPLSWADDGALAFGWSGSNAGGIRVLNTNSAGGSLIARSRRVVADHLPGGLSSVGSTGTLSTNGRLLTVPVYAIGSRTGNEFQQFSVATGRKIRVLWPVPFDAPVDVAIWSNSSGSVLVVAAPPTRNGTSHNSVFGVLSGDHFVKIPGLPVSSVGATFVAF